MQFSQVHDYASQLLKLHGDRAQLVAAQKLLAYQECGNHQKAEDWRRVRAALKQMQEPHAS